MRCGAISAGNGALPSDIEKLIKTAVHNDVHCGFLRCHEKYVRVLTFLPMLMPVCRIRTFLKNVLYVEYGKSLKRKEQK